MARKEIVTYRYTCDLCGAEIPANVDASRRVSFDGRDYEIDLCDSDARGLDQALEGVQAFVKAARRIEGRGRRTRRTETDTKVVRAWARANGWPNLGDRGRVPAEAARAYEEAGQPTA